MELNPEESSKLGLIAQFSKLTRARKELEEMVRTLRPSARNVGLILLGKEPESVKPGERETARAYEAWQGANARIGSRRAQTLAATVRRDGLDARHRDKASPKAGEIQQKRGDTANKSIPKPIPLFSRSTKRSSTIGKVPGKVSGNAVSRAAKTGK